MDTSHTIVGLRKIIAFTFALLYNRNVAVERLFQVRGYAKLLQRTAVEPFTLMPL